MGLLGSLASAFWHLSLLHALNQHLLVNQVVPAVLRWGPFYSSGISAFSEISFLGEERLLVLSPSLLRAGWGAWVLPDGLQGNSKDQRISSLEPRKSSGGLSPIHIRTDNRSKPREVSSGLVMASWSSVLRLQPLLGTFSKGP